MKQLVIWNLMISFSIIVPTYNDWKSIKKNFLHLDRYKYKLEILIINNNKKKFIPNFIPKWFKVIHEPKPGSYSARNTGIKKSSCKYIFFTDSDCYIPTKTIDLLIKLSKKTSNVVSGRTIIKSTGTNNTYTKYDKLFAFNFSNMKKNKTAVTANLFVPKHFFKSVGLFNDTIFSGGDVYWTKKYSKKFKIIYRQDLVILHPPRESLFKILTKTKRVVGGRLKIFPFKTIFSIFLFIPLKRTLKILNSKETLITKLKLLALLYTIKCFEIFEVIIILLGKEKVRK